jgi:outer membrane protein
MVSLTTPVPQCAVARAESKPNNQNGVALDAVISATLGKSPVLLLAAAEVERARGAMLAAREPFDDSLTAELAGRRGYEFSQPQPPEVPVAISLDQRSVSAGWSKQFRSGITVTSVASTSQTQFRTQPPLDLTEASVRVALIAHLLRDRGSAITASPERASAAALAASTFEGKEAIAQQVLQSALAYWEYLAAQERLAVFVASEALARRTAMETRALVQADERTLAEAIQAQGHYASRRAARIAAELEVLGAWQQVALVAGLDARDLSGLPEPTTEFPKPGPEPTAEALARWSKDALELRPVLAAAEMRIQETEVQMRAARNDFSPSLDLELGVGYSAEILGAGLRQLAIPFYRDTPGVDASIRLRYGVALEHSRARGRLIQSRVLYEEQRLAASEAQRQLQLGVRMAFETVKHSRLGLKESEEAASLLQQTVDSERLKFHLGSSTVFTVIQAEELLTGALLARIDGRASYAVALAKLRFESGTLLRREGASGRANAATEIVDNLGSLP